MPEHQRVEQEPVRAGRTTGPAHPAVEGRTAQLLALQRSAGNNAVSGVLAREPVQGPVPTEPRSAVDSGAPGSVFALLPDDRKTVEGETAMEISTAFTAFTDACRANIDAMKAAAKAKAEVVALVVDICTGFAAPAFATTTTKLLDRLAAHASASVEAAGKEKVVALISRSDLLKASFTGVSKVAADQIKRNSTRLFGEQNEDALLDQLKTEFQSGAVGLGGRLHAMTDAELLAVWHAYDPEYANVSVYKERIKSLLDQYAQFVGAIMETELAGERAMGDYSTTTLGIRAYRIDAYGRTRTVLVKERSEHGAFSSSGRTFHAWVPPTWEPMAVERTQQLFGAFTEIKGEQIDGHIPAPA